MTWKVGLAALAAAVLGNGVAEVAGASDWARFSVGLACAWAVLALARWREDPPVEGVRPSPLSRDPAFSDEDHAQLMELQGLSVEARVELLERENLRRVMTERRIVETMEVAAGRRRVRDER